MSSVTSDPFLTDNGCPWLLIRDLNLGIYYQNELREKLIISSSITSFYYLNKMERIETQNFCGSVPVFVVLNSDPESVRDIPIQKTTRTHQYLWNWPGPGRHLLPPCEVMPTKMAPVKSQAMLNDSKIITSTTDSGVGRAEGYREKTESLRFLVRVRIG